MKKAFITSFILLFGLCFSTSIGQETQTAIMNVHSQVTSSVSISVTGLDFGELSTQSTTDATGTISVMAATGVIYNIALDEGQNWDSYSRTMLSDSGTSIGYGLWKDAGLQPEDMWGDSDFGGAQPIGTSAGPFTGDGTAQNYTVYGQANSAPLVVLDDFNDLVTVTVHY
ncbi:MAG: spore coat protein U domain-containing protein [Candidatus Aminicenantes bacterium]|nr:MAG: spore coat protein U domain-containing protein [Candidatus Aminicenantes bacterium]